MLVLRRKVGERIVIGGRIEVSVLAVEGDRVKLGISAPPDISIVREELVRHPSSPSSLSAMSITPEPKRKEMAANRTGM